MGSSGTKSEEIIYSTLSISYTILKSNHITVNPDIFQLNELPTDMKTQVMLKLPYKDLLPLFRVNRAFNNISKDHRFWENKFRKDYPEIDYKCMGIENCRYGYELTYYCRLEKENEEKLRLVNSTLTRKSEQLNYFDYKQQFNDHNNNIKEIVEELKKGEETIELNYRMDREKNRRNMVKIMQEKYVKLYPELFRY
jgi:hypothetical protein